MARTTAAKVKEIISTDQADSVIEAFILGAVAIVTENLETSGLSEDTLAEIERWLAAHLMAVTLERQPIEMGGGPAPSIRFTDHYEQGLSLTSYGQMAMTLDTSGTLASLGLKSASITAVTSFE